MKLLLVVLFAIFSKSESLWCPDGAFRFPGEYNCASPIALAKNYQNAKAACELLGGTLAKVLNTFENTYLTALISPDFKKIPPYIGVVKNGSKWTYSDGTALSYSAFNTGETDKAENCVFLDPKTARWNVSDCSANRPFYCTFNGIKNSCPNNWVYSRDTDYCYYLQNFEYIEGETWKVYNFETADAKCQEMDPFARLVSIHSSTEDTFVYNLISSNVRTMLSTTNTCSNQWAWIGYTGNGTVGTGNWTDGSPVDYIPTKSSYIYSAVMTNDQQCSTNYRTWSYASPSTRYPRFVCKMESKGFDSVAVIKKAIKKEEQS